MALIKCKECGKEISDKATTCPGCGAKTEMAINNNNNNNKNIIIAISIIVIIATIGITTYFIRTSNSLYKYSRETIEILEQYQNADLTNKEASRKIKNLHDVINSKSRNEELTKSISLGKLASELYLISIELEDNKLSNSKIDEYITELKQY